MQFIQFGSGGLTLGSFGLKEFLAWRGLKGVAESHTMNFQ